MLLAAQGLQDLQIGKALGIDRITAGRWRRRYIESGLSGIEQDLPRGAPPTKVDMARLVELTTQTLPEAATHWSTRKMAAVLKVSPSTVMRHWQAHGLKPHIVRGFKVSRAIRSSLTSSRTSSACTFAARARAGAVLRREEPNPGAGPHAARAAAEKGRGRP